MNYDMGIDFLYEISVNLICLYPDMISNVDRHSACMALTYECKAIKLLYNCKASCY